jgi:hypothetical protein
MQGRLLVELLVFSVGEWLFCPGNDWYFVYYIEVNHSETLTVINLLTALPLLLIFLCKN